MSFKNMGPHDGRGMQIHERCPDCGARQAYELGDIVLLKHEGRCTVSGPSDPPMRFRAETVEFVPGLFDIAELRAQRDKSEAELFKMRPEYHRMKRAIDDAIRELEHGKP